jgi:hypothetical protein
MAIAFNYASTKWIRRKYSYRKQFWKEMGRWWFFEYATNILAKYKGIQAEDPGASAEFLTAGRVGLGSAV